MDRKRKLHYYKYIVKRHLNDIRAHIGQSKNEMEKVITAPAMPPN